VPTVYISQVPHRRSANASTLIPAVDVTSVEEHGTMRVLAPPGFVVNDVAALMDELRATLQSYDVEKGDSLLTMGDAVVAACAIAILARHGPFAILRWHKHINRYSRVLIHI